MGCQTREVVEIGGGGEKKNKKQTNCQRISRQNEERSEEDFHK